MIVVSSVDQNLMPNISPRTTFTITDDIIYWIELFKQAETFSRRYWNANDLKNGASGEVI